MQENIEFLRNQKAGEALESLEDTDLVVLRRLREAPHKYTDLAVSMGLDPNADQTILDVCLSVIRLAKVHAIAVDGDQIIIDTPGQSALHLTEIQFKKP